MTGRRREPDRAGPGRGGRRPLPEQVAGLMRAGGWREVTVAAAMGRLGTDVIGVGADGRRWVVRCHHDAGRLDAADVRRFADAVRELRRGEVAVLVTEQPPSTSLLRAALRCGTRLVDRAGLIWWARLQHRTAGPRA
jgi:Restriction endonuclease